MANEKIEILKTLIGNREETFSIRKLALVRKINYKSAYNAVRALEKEEVIELKRAGNTIICAFNDKFSDLVFKAEYMRREELFRKKDFLIIYDSLAQLQFPFIVLSFGSHVKGAETKHSDIDLLLICDEENAKIVGQKLGLFSYNIHLTSIDYEGFVRMAKSKEFTVVSEVIKKNIILVGIEEYYRLLKNAGQ